MTLMATGSPPRHGFEETVRGAGSMRYQVRALNLVTAPAAVQERLHLQAGDDVLLVERLRTVDGTPVSLEVCYLLLDVARDVVGSDLTTSDIWALIQAATGQRLDRVDLLVEAISADTHLAAVLGTTKGAPLLTLERLTLLDDGTPVELEVSRLRGDRLSLRGTTHGPTLAGA
jgi:GntR family transcriptional regulator